MHPQKVISGMQTMTAVGIPWFRGELDEEEESESPYRSSKEGIVYPDEESSSESSRSSRASPRFDVDVDVELDPSSQKVAFEGELSFS
jgi:hypothetical protein